MRLFFALWPPAIAARALAQWAEEARRATGGRATPEEKIHLTLAFLGEADPLKAVSAARRVSASAHALPIEEARYVRENQMVWVRPRATPAELQALFDRLSMELYREEFILERRPFAAHVTLVRKARRAELPALPPLDWPVGEFLLVASKGGRYEPVERFPL
jgi:2'-5' RNA ligase